MAHLQHEIDALAVLLDAPDGPGELVHLVRHGYGSALAGRLAMTPSERVASLVLYEPTAFPLPGQPHPYRPDAFGIAVIAETDRVDLTAGAAGFVDCWIDDGAGGAVTSVSCSVAEADLVVWAGPRRCRVARRCGQFGLPCRWSLGSPRAAEISRTGSGNLSGWAGSAENL